MPRVIADSPDAGRIDAAMRSWRQGDVARDLDVFVHVANPASALTDAAAEEGGDEPVAVVSSVPGIVVLTQTCDIVRNCVERPYIEVAPLVEVAPDVVEDVRRWRRPSYAFVPALAGERLVADLDRSLAVEKAVVAAWSRRPGWTTDDEARAFASALARKRARFAFPDDFVHLCRDLQHRLIEKHGKSSGEGRALRALREIRVRASPSWGSPAIELMFWFVREEEDQASADWSAMLVSWLERVPATGRFQEVSGQVTTLGRMTAEEYVESDPLDLDRLSTPMA